MITISTIVLGVSVASIEATVRGSPVISLCWPINFPVSGVCEDCINNWLPKYHSNASMTRACQPPEHRSLSLMPLLCSAYARVHVSSDASQEGSACKCSVCTSSTSSAVLSWLLPVTGVPLFPPRDWCTSGKRSSSFLLSRLCRALRFRPSRCGVGCFPFFRTAPWVRIPLVLRSIKWELEYSFKDITFRIMARLGHWEGGLRTSLFADFTPQLLVTGLGCTGFDFLDVVNSLPSIRWSFVSGMSGEPRITGPPWFKGDGVIFRHFTWSSKRESWSQREGRNEPQC